MRLYVCFGTARTPRPGGHPCANAYDALRDAGHEPELVKAYGLGPLPAFLNVSRGRREVRNLTGNFWVPVLVTDRGKVVQGSKQIIAWAKEHPAKPPAGTPAPAAG